MCQMSKSEKALPDVKKMLEFINEIIFMPTQRHSYSVTRLVP